MRPEPVTLSLMGNFALRRKGRRQPLPLAGRTRLLLMYLAARANTAVRREEAIDEIWPDAAEIQGNQTLNTALGRIRGALEAYEDIALRSEDGLIRLDVNPPARIDARILEQAVEMAQTTTEDIGTCWLGPLRHAVEECRGEFLEGCMETWALGPRERYRALRVMAMTLLMERDARDGRYEHALMHGRAILDIDPFREATQRAVMRLYAANGQRVQAIRQYRALVNLLWKELQIAPMDATTRTFEAIVAGAPVPEDLAASGPVASDL